MGWERSHPDEQRIDRALAWIMAVTATVVILGSIWILNFFWR